MSKLSPSTTEIVARDTKCRLCTLASRDPELFEHIHTRWREMPDAAKLAAETASAWKSMKEPHIDSLAFTRHFTTHVQVRLTPPPAQAVATKTTQAVVIADEGVADPTPFGPRGVAAVDLTEREYFDMQDIIDRLRRRMQEVDDKVTFFDSEGQVSHNESRVLLKIFDSLRQALESLNKMRNSDKLTRAILKTHTKRFVQHLSGPLVSRFDGALERIRETGGSNESIAELERLVQHDVKDLIITAAETAVRESSDVYWLH